MTSKWTMKDTLIGRTRSVIILTVLLTMAIIRIVNQLLTHEVVQENGMVTTFHFSLGIYGLVFAIPAGLISILIVKFFVNIKKDKTNAIQGDRTFKWYSIYGTICGFIILMPLIDLLRTYTAEMLVTNVWEGFQMLGILFMPIIIAIVFARLINYVLIQITNTNGYLIEQIKAGHYHSDLPNDEVKSKVIKLLETGRVSTIKGGLVLLRVRNAILTVGGGILFALFFLFRMAAPKMEGTNPAIGGDYSQSNIHNARRRLKDQAYYNAEQKRKQADHSRRRYISQANYNAKYSKREWDQAVRDERAYKKAKRDADLL
ncbi:hypothetical protein SAMN04488134_107176 [Amphibacillus marinus]|uniref:Uncharacterized protein n=1 Tax=Amphibacillus marinus TaxID=872970 RepID=A0A1H8PU53_9BACI|nr:hypothetical protein [Amphibacillus marinus]SEO45073.1 hypothetical protein SAMN04488134_107176 [Amphibacillus marinus]